MALNPGDYADRKVQELLDDMFHPNESPYFAMYSAGKNNIPLDKVMDKLARIGVPVRAKDIENWQRGNYEARSIIDPTFVVPKRIVTTTGVDFDDSKLSDFPMFPQSWTPPKRRFFPCTQENKPLQKWGWTSDYSPQLYEQSEAKKLSPCGWVGQNMLYQRFIVIDIDGRGHGEDDQYVIAFGELFKDQTFCMEDPSKPGSFHLYFSTDRVIPVRHFPYAKLDLMGNAVNAAVYLKNKVSNGKPMMQLTERIWQMMQSYAKFRKELS